MQKEWVRGVWRRSLQGGARPTQLLKNWRSPSTSETSPAGALSTRAASRDSRSNDSSAGVSIRAVRRRASSRLSRWRTRWSSSGASSVPVPSSCPEDTAGPPCACSSINTAPPERGNSTRLGGIAGSGRVERTSPSPRPGGSSLWAAGDPVSPDANDPAPESGLLAPWSALPPSVRQAPAAGGKSSCNPIETGLPSLRWSRFCWLGRMPRPPRPSARARHSRKASFNHSSSPSIATRSR
jgi:hypothetical protein